MSNLIVMAAAALLTLPFAASYIVYIIVVKKTKNKGRALRMAADVTTILFIGAVHLLVQEIWEESYLWVIFLVILITAVMFTIIHYRARQEIEFFRLFKGIWRFTFFLFSTAYLILAVFGWGVTLFSAFIG